MKINIITKLIFLGLFGIVMLPNIGGTQSSQPEEQPLPERPVAIEVDAPDRVNYRIAVPEWNDPLIASMTTDVLRTDFQYSGVFQVIQARSYPSSAEAEGLGIHRAAWTAIGAQAVIKGESRRVGDQIEIEARLYEVGRAANDEPTLVKTYRGSEADVRKNVHLFANEVLGQITGKPGVFDTRLVFARRPEMGRKDIHLVDYDGANLTRVSNGEGISMLPNFGVSRIWYSRLTQYGMFITRTDADERPIIDSEGLNMGVSVCDGRVFFTSTRDGNSEIYSANDDGTDIRRLTNHPAIDVSPTCGPNDKIAFVSNRHGSPQIFVMNRSGGEPRRVTFKGSHNQTPSWCQDPARPLIAFTGRDEGMDIFTVNIVTGAYVRITQAQGLNKDPSFSADCRMIAFHSSRQEGGIYISNPSGFNQHRVLDGYAETIRWEPRAQVSLAVARPMESLPDSTNTTEQNTNSTTSSTTTQPNTRQNRSSMRSSSMSNRSR